MADTNRTRGPVSDTSAARDALRRELSARGHEVASDTLGSRGELYIVGQDDLAAALFEFKSSAREACDTMYQGSWIEGLPPRFAVLPRESAEEPCFELLEQMRVIPLLYGNNGGGIEFDDLDGVLASSLRH